MFGVLITLGVIGTLVWSYFDPLWASKVFLFGFIGLFEGYIFLMSRVGRPDGLEPFTEPLYLNPDEVTVVKKYHLFFKFPFASRQFSGAMSGIQLSTFIWVPWLLYNGLWFTAVAIGGNYFAASFLAMQLNPRLFLQRALGPAALYAQSELLAIDSAIEKLTKCPARERDVT